MRYTQKITFEREFVIEAKNAAEANEKLKEAVDRAEWDADLINEGYYAFEDEPITCPKCKGDGEIKEVLCDLCKGEACVPFGTVFEPQTPPQC